MDLENYFLVVKRSQKKESIITDFIKLLNFKLAIDIEKIFINSFLKTYFFNNIIIYKNKEYIKIIRRIIEKNLRI